MSKKKAIVSRSKAMRLAEEVGASVTGTVLGLAIAGPAGAVAGAALGAIAGVAVEVLERKRERAAAMLEIAQRESGKSISEIVADASSDSRRLNLLASAIAGAADSTIQEKLSAFARAVTQGTAGTDHDADNMLVVVKILSQLELPHVAVLAQIAQSTHDAPKTIGWTPDELLQSVPQHAIIMRSIVRMLELQGLIADAARLDPVNLGGKVFWNITELGALCLKLLYDKDKLFSGTVE